MDNSALAQFQNAIDGFTSPVVPLVILSLVFLFIIAAQIIFTLKSDNVLIWIAPIFFGIAGGFANFITASYYQNAKVVMDTYEPVLTPNEFAMAPNYSAFELLFIILGILYFISAFVSFVIAVIKAVRRRNMY